MSKNKKNRYLEYRQQISEDYQHGAYVPIYRGKPTSKDQVVLAPTGYSIKPFEES